MKRSKKDSKETFDDQIQQQALPIDPNFLIDEDYYIDEGEKDALEYLQRVHNQDGDQNKVYTSQKYKCSQNLPDLQNTTGRDYLQQSLSRLYFTPSSVEKEAQGQNISKIYQDQDLVFNKEKTTYTNQSFWDQSWLEQVLQQRAQMQTLIRQKRQTLKKFELFQDENQYFSYAFSLSQQEICEQTLAKAGEIVLQSIFGVIVAEKEDEWDEKEEIEYKDLLILYGLLCVLEKPLLPDQAGDLNSLLNLLLKQKSGMDKMKKSLQLAQIDINIAIITEYFEQRFK